jgi:hypothetical protein
MKVDKRSTQSGVRWTISTSIVDPVAFSAYATAPTVDEAAAKVIADLETAIGEALP